MNGTEQNPPEDEHTPKGRLLLREKEVVKRLLLELKDARLRKLVASAQNGIEINSANLTREERELAKDLETSLNAFKQERREPKPPPSEEEVQLSVLRFLQDIPEIVGTDLKIYGPYKKEDVGSLPNQNAVALIRQGAAKEIEIRKVSIPQKTG